MLARIRIWLPDAPGALAGVAAEIGAVRGNVVGLEVLEREAGVAVDELVIELPDDAGAIDALCRGVRNVPGAGIEEVTELRGAGSSRPGDAPDREEGVLEAATAILAGSTPEVALEALTASLVALFGLSWLAVMEDAVGQFVRSYGDPPTAGWVVAFAAGAQSGSRPDYDTTGSGVFVEPVAGAGLTVCAGRPSAIRRRERHEISMLVTVTSRYMGALTGRA
ncbi:MAG TPA: hypothetical protein VIY26_16660 [Acidimicrobiales bacterium]